MAILSIVPVPPPILINDYHYFLQKALLLFYFANCGLTLVEFKVKISNLDNIII